MTIDQWIFHYKELSLYEEKEADSKYELSRALLEAICKKMDNVSEFLAVLISPDNFIKYQDHIKTVNEGLDTPEGFEAAYEELKKVMPKAIRPDMPEVEYNPFAKGSTPKSYSELGIKKKK